MDQWVVPVERSFGSPVVSWNDVEWEPVPGVEYCHDYGKIFDFIAGNPESERRVLRELCLDDLFFLVHFVLRVPRANHPFIVQACRDLQMGPKSHTLDCWAREHFKAVDLNEHVPTPDGWKKHGDLREGDFVFGADGSQRKVVGRSEVFYEGDCYRVTFSDGYSVVVNGDHLWEVGKKSRRRVAGGNGKREYRDYSVLKTSDIFKHKHTPDNRLSVKLAEPLRCSEKILPIHPYVLGAWLGDGDSAGARFTSDDPEIVDKIIRCGFAVKKAPQKFRYSILGLHKTLRLNSLINNKHIPLEYLRSSEWQRIELLRGLMDTGGTVDSRGTATFTSIKEVLARGVFELAGTLGLSPSIRKHKSKINGEDYFFYQVSFQSYLNKPVFSLQRKFAKSKTGNRTMKGKYIVGVEKVPTIPTSCIKVDSADGLYLIGEKFTVTHNTTIVSVAESIQCVLRDPECTVGIFSFARDPALAILRSIKDILERSEILKWCFPDILYTDPRNESPVWGEDKGLVVRRTGFQKESTFEAWGLIDSMPTGKHFKRRMYDDVVTEKLVPPNGSPEMMAKVKTNFDLSENLGSEGGTCRVIGTFYHYEDPLVYIGEKRTADGYPVFHTRIKPATENGEFNGKSVFISEERIAVLRTNKKTFATQQLLDPTPIEMRDLDPAFLIECEPADIPQRLFRFITVDFAGVEKNRVDGGDSWAIHLIGVNPVLDQVGGSDIYLLDSIIKPMSMNEAMGEIVNLYLRGGQVWQVGVEKVGATTMEVHVKNALAARGKRGAEVKVLSPAGRKKQFRILEALEWPLRNGKIKISKAVPAGVRERLRMEMNKFPYWHDDGLDSLAYVYDMLRDFPFARYRSKLATDGRNDAYGKSKIKWPKNGLTDRTFLYV